MRLKQELERVLQERDVLKKRSSSLPGKAGEVRLHQREPWSVSGKFDGRGVGGVGQRLLRLVAAGAE